jgi:hypothetical protein
LHARVATAGSNRSRRSRSNEGKWHHQGALGQCERSVSPGQVLRSPTRRISRRGARHSRFPEHRQPEGRRCRARKEPGRGRGTDVPFETQFNGRAASRTAYSHSSRMTTQSMRSSSP